MVTKHVDIFVRSYHLIVQRQQNFGYPLSLFRGISKPRDCCSFWNIHYFNSQNTTERAVLCYKHFQGNSSFLYISVR